jgi:hypothetical protein
VRGPASHGARPRRTLARLALASPAGALLGALAVHGCTIMNGLTVPSADAGRDAEARDAPLDRCDHAYPPDDPPAAVEDGDIEFVTAVTGIDLGVNGGGAGAGGAPEFPGFDLDRTCSCPAEPSCANARAPACDDARGRDDSFATLARAVAAKGVDLQARVAEGIAKGASGLLVIVESYNGKADDPRVYVTLASTPGLRPLSPDGGAGRKQTPTFTRADKWLLDGTEFFELGNVVTSRRRDIGYIKDGRLTVRIPKASIAFGEDGLVIRFAEGFLVGRVEPDGAGSFVVRSGELAGRWSVREALLSAREVRPAEGLDRLCRLPTVFASLKDEVCGAADIAARSADDRTGTRCDAVSTALSFTGAPGSKGAIYQAPVNDPCPEALPAETECPP